VHPTRSNEVSRSKLKEMPDLLYRRRNAIALAGIAVLLVGLGVAIGIDAGAGLAVVGLAALLLASVQPQLLAHLRSRQARRGAPHELPVDSVEGVRPDYGLRSGHVRHGLERVPAVRQAAADECEPPSRIAEARHADASRHAAADRVAVDGHADRALGVRQRLH